MKAKIPCGSLVVLLAFGQLVAHETPAQRHEMATNQLKRIAADISMRCLQNIRSLNDWTQGRAELRRELLDMLGLDPLPARAPLKAEITGRLEREGYRIEKIVYQSLPGLYVTGNLYLPKAPAKRLPAVL